MGHLPAGGKESRLLALASRSRHRLRAGGRSRRRGVHERVDHTRTDQRSGLPHRSGLPYARYQLTADHGLVLRPPDAAAMRQLATAKATAAAHPNVWLAHSALARHVWYASRLLRVDHVVRDWVKKTYLRDDADPDA